MGAAISFCDYLRQASNYTDVSDTHVMLIHHTNKAETAERGSTALRGACDTMLGMRHLKTKNIYLLGIDKQRDAEEGEPITLDMRPVPELQSAVICAKDFIYEGYDMRKFVKITKGELTPRQCDVLISHLLHYHESATRGLSAREIGNFIGMAPPNVTYYRGALREHGYVSALEDGRTQITAEGVKYLVDNGKVTKNVSPAVLDLIDATMAQYKAIPAATGEDNG
jgi:DNA-binding transcriptional ArsR family regulator